MAHIERRKKNRWRARYRAPDGRERSKTFDRKIDAERFLVNVEVEKLKGQWVDPRLGRTTVGEWAESWFASLVRPKQRTIYGYRSVLNRHVLPAFGDVPLGRLEPMAIREWVSGMTTGGVGPSTIRQAWLLLSQILGAAVKDGLIVRNPAQGVEIPRIRPRERFYLTADEVVRLAEETPEPYDTLVWVLAGTGVRFGEAAALRRKRCDLLRSRLDIAEAVEEVAGRIAFGETKTYTRRAAALPPLVRDRLAAHMRTVPPKPDSLVFTGPEGGPLRYSLWYPRVFRPAVVRAGLPENMGVHSLRHTFAALSVANGEHPKSIQTALGHSSIQVTLDTYGHLYPDALEAAAQRLDETFRDATSRIPAASPRPGLEVVRLSNKK